MFDRSIPDHLPEEMQPIVQQLQQAGSKRECLQMAYDAVTSRYHGCRNKTYPRIYELIPKSISTLWARTGFIHCTNFTWLLRILLLKSGHFSDADVRTRWTLYWYISPHQYVQVRIDDEWINVDAWAHRYGIPLGDYARGFRTGVTQ